MILSSCFSDIQVDAKDYRLLVIQMPESNALILRGIAELALIMWQSIDITKMDPGKLAVCLGPNLLKKNGDAGFCDFTFFFFEMAQNISEIFEGFSLPKFFPEDFWDYLNDLDNGGVDTSRKGKELDALVTSAHEELETEQSVFESVTQSQLAEQSLFSPADLPSPIISPPSSENDETTEEEKLVEPISLKTQFEEESFPEEDNLTRDASAEEKHSAEHISLQTELKEEEKEEEVPSRKPTTEDKMDEAIISLKSQLEETFPAEEIQAQEPTAE